MTPTNQNSANPTTQPNNDLLAQLHPSLRDSFVAIPAHAEHCTSEQLSAIFGGDVLAALREIVALVREAARIDEGAA